MKAFHEHLFQYITHAIKEYNSDINLYQTTATNAEYPYIILHDINYKNTANTDIKYVSFTLLIYCSNNQYQICSETMEAVHSRITDDDFLQSLSTKGICGAKLCVHDTNITVNEEDIINGTMKVSLYIEQDQNNQPTYKEIAYTHNN